MHTVFHMFDNDGASGFGSGSSIDPCQNGVKFILNVMEICEFTNKDTKQDAMHAVHAHCMATLQTMRK